MSAVPSAIGGLGAIDTLFKVLEDLVALRDRLWLSDSQELLLVSIVVSGFTFSWLVFWLIFAFSFSLELFQEKISNLSLVAVALLGAHSLLPNEVTELVGSTEIVLAYALDAVCLGSTAKDLW